MLNILCDVIHHHHHHHHHHQLSSSIVQKVDIHEVINKHVLRVTNFTDRTIRQFRKRLA